VALEYGLDLLGGDVMADARLVEGAREVLGRKPGSEVNERARHGGDRNGAPDGGVAGVHAAGPAGPDAFHPALGGRDDLGRRRRALGQAEEMRGGRSREQRPVSASKDSGQVAGVGARRRVAHAIDAPVDRNQRAIGDPLGDFVARKARP
jgi:hypothetical protein